MDNSKIPVVVDDSEEYEKLSFMRKLINIFWLPFLNLLPEFSRKWIAKSSLEASIVIEQAKNFKALESMYNYDNKHHTFCTGIWLNLINCKAIRNRLRLVKKLIVKAIIKSRKDEIRIASIGSGSARAILETIKEFPDIKFSCLFLDISRSAINYSRELALSLGLDVSTMEWRRDSVDNFSTIVAEFKPDIVEMVGLLDYFNQNESIVLVSKIASVLSKKGVFLVSNVCDNPERPFVTTVIKWSSMTYKDIADMKNIIIEGGFDPQESKLYLEPLKVHAIGYCVSS